MPTRLATNAELISKAGKETTGNATVRKLQRYLLTERRLPIRAESEIGRLRSLKTKLQNSVLRYREAENAQGMKAAPTPRPLESFAGFVPSRRA
jgi:hypothetical protein